MKEKSGMKSPTMPKEQFTRNEGKLGHTSDLKYASDMGAPQEYDKANKALADYAKKNRFKQN